MSNLWSTISRFEHFFSVSSYDKKWRRYKINATSAPSHLARFYTWVNMIFISTYLRFYLVYQHQTKTGIEFQARTLDRSWQQHLMWLCFYATTSWNRHVIWSRRRDRWLLRVHVICTYCSLLWHNVCTHTHHWKKKNASANDKINIQYFLKYKIAK